MRPSVSVISVGAGNPYGHPSPRTVYLAGDDGARVLRTDRDGMVLIGAPDGPNAPIPVRADKGDGVVPTAEPTPSGLDRTQGGSRSHSRRRRTHEGEGGSRSGDGGSRTEGLGPFPAPISHHPSIRCPFGCVSPLARMMSNL